MPSGTELASVVGTWAAVGLALVALFGIVTPILLLRRATSERNIALKAIDDKNHEFVRRHFKLPGLFFGQSINVPNLRNAPVLRDLSLRRDDRALERRHSTTSWIMFARLLNAYSIKVPLGGTLKIYHSQAWLPVHKLWILTIGLLGRYGHRIDRGRVRSAPTEARIDQRDVDYDNDKYSVDPKSLSGITGDFRYTPNAFSSDIEEGVGQLHFIARDKETRGSLQPDDVPLTHLFWMSLGCVPLSDGRIFDVYKHTELERADFISKPDSGNRNWISNSDTSSESSREPGSELEPWPWPKSRPRSGNLAYRFQPIQNIILGARVISWAQSLLGNLPEILRLQSYDPTTSEEETAMRALLAPSEHTEDVSSPWVTSASFDVDKYFRKEVLLWRSDIQALALGMMELRWSTRGCLFDAKRGRFCRRILCQPSSRLYALSETTLRICKAATPTDARKDGLIKALQTILPMCSWRPRSGFSRELHEGLFALEQCLLSKSTRTVPFLAVGIVFITSKRFQKFVLFLAKDHRNCDSNCKVLSVDPNADHVLVHSNNEVSELRFTLNFGEVFNASKEQASATLTREEVLFAALSACVRSVAFQFSYDSKPLLDFVGRIDELVYVSARTEMPLVGTGSGWARNPNRREKPQFFAMEGRGADESYVRNRRDDAKDVDDDPAEDNHASRPSSDLGRGYERDGSTNDESYVRNRQDDATDVDDNPVKENHATRPSSDQGYFIERKDSTNNRSNNISRKISIPIRKTHTSRSDNKDRAESDHSDSSEEHGFDRPTEHLDVRVMKLEIESAIILKRTELKQEETKLRHQFREFIEKSAQRGTRPTLDHTRIHDEGQTSLRLSLELIEEKRRQIGRDRRLCTWKDYYPTRSERKSEDSKGFLTEADIHHERRTRMVEERTSQLELPKRTATRVHFRDTSTPSPVDG